MENRCSTDRCGANAPAEVPGTVGAGTIGAGTGELPGGGSARKELYLQPKADCPEAAKRQSYAAVYFHGLTGAPSEVQNLAEMSRELGLTSYVPCLSGHEDTISELKVTTTGQWLNDVADARQRLAEVGKSKFLVCGKSFGALLAMEFAEKYPGEVVALVLISPPLEFRSRLREAVLPLLSIMPDGFLNRLGVVDKPVARRELLHLKREAFLQHSIASAARLVAIRRRVLAAAATIRCPVLLLTDPYDHHLSEGVPHKLQDLLPAGSLETRLFPGGEHELTLGPKHREVVQAIEGFFADILSIRSGGENSGSGNKTCCEKGPCPEK